MSESDKYVFVRRSWNDCNIAKVPFEAITGLRWDIYGGGASSGRYGGISFPWGIPAPRPFLHGYIWCDAVVEGEVSHSCCHGEGPHNIKICIVKKDNCRAIYDELASKVS